MRQSFTLTICIIFMTACTAKQAETSKSESQIDASIKTLQAEDTQNKADEIRVKMIKVADNHFGLKPTKTGCNLIIEGQPSIELGLLPNCVFNSMQNGDVRISKGHHGPVILAQSSIETHKSYGVQRCDTRVAAITVSDGKVYAEPSIGSMGGVRQHHARLG